VEGKEGLMAEVAAPATEATSIQNLVLRVVGVAGAALFAFFFALTFSTPQWVERFATDFIESRVSERVDAGIENLRPEPGDSSVSMLAESLYRQNDERIDDIRQDLKGRAQQRWSAALAQVRDLSCECRSKIMAALTLGSVLEMKSLEAVNQRLTEYIQASYMDVAAKLKGDIRIFAATNAGVFLLMVLLSFLKPQAVRHLFLPGLLLTVATILCAYMYVFEQNWLLTIIHGDYLGLAYAVYLGAAFLFLCDIALNCGRVTTRLVNGVVHGFGGVFSLVPC
jgi:hypothetical protein